jgi:hypothetical protein
LKEQVPKAYPEALKALETRFSKAFGSVAGTQEDGVGTPTHIRIGALFTFASNGPDLARVTRRASATAMNNKTAIAPRETVFCYKKESSFWLVKEEGKTDFAIRSLAANEKEQSFIRNQMGPWLYQYLHAPFSLGGLPTTFLIADGGAAIGRVSSVRRNDRTYLKIEFDFKNGRNNRLRDQSGWALVAPDEKWVIHEYELKDGVSVYHGRVEYAQPQDGFPVLKRVVSTRAPLGGQPTDLEIYEFKELHFGDVPESEFRLSSFGLADARPSP